MKYENILTKQVLTLLLIVGMLVTLIFCFSSSAEAATRGDAIDKAIYWLKSNQDEAGVWGITEGYESDVLDTVIVINSLTDEKNIEADVLKRAVSYLISTQNSDSSWSLNDSDDVAISLTAQAAITLNLFQTKTNLTSNELQKALRKAREYLVSVQKEDKRGGLMKLQ